MNSNKNPSSGSRSTIFGSIPVWLRGRKSLWVAGAAIYTIVYSAWVLMKWTNPAWEPLVANLGYLPVGFFAAISAIYAANQNQIDQRTRRAWQFIALGLILFVVGDILYTVLDLTLEIVFPSIPDFFYLAFYPLVFLGLITIPSHLSDPAQRKTWILDIAIIITGFTAILWYFIIAPKASSAGHMWAAGVVAGAYPVMDILLLASIASLLFRRGEVNTRRSLSILGVGLVIYVSADIAYAWLLLQNAYHSGSWVDIIWTVSYFMIGLAALRQATPYLIESQAKRDLRISWQSSLVPFLVVFVSVLLSLFSAASQNGSTLEKTGLWLGTTLHHFADHSKTSHHHAREFEACTRIKLGLGSIKSQCPNP